MELKEDPIYQILDKLGIKEAKDKKILENSKMKDFLEYCKNNDVEVSKYVRKKWMVKPETLLYFIENMYSYDKVINVISNLNAREQATFDYKTVSNWYNIYDPNKLELFANGYEILLDAEYLKYASPDWTENVLFNLNEWLYFDGKYHLKKNSLEEGDEGFFNPFYDNVLTLVEEKKKGRLESAVKFLISSTSKN